ncbi:hypothetical protein Poly21_11230 [Allorhodopirellula heiligendammensis]|uniref:Uncharacterized protein n=1 Tax=Allorhodopirellula heiligendammensis TaxID=2714739 RepID=A0A5C6C4E1_9BACT|nr:hypothetical protein Poly21_11230 [Allorhodopirellula heiligendammensis]
MSRYTTGSNNGLTAQLSCRPLVRRFHELPTQLGDHVLGSMRSSLSGLSWILGNRGG